MLKRPDGLDDDQWLAIDDCALRLQRAERDHDLPLIVGSAKELVESVARVVLACRGETVSSNTDMGRIISRAHAALERQPGPELSSDPDVREIAQGAKRIAKASWSLRNRFGTGHGRATPAEVKEEVATVAAEAARLWSGWALRRLEHLIAGLPAAIAHDLRVELFYKGTLARRLKQANLPALAEDDQRLLGLAVGRRATRGTFVVAEDGVEACAEDPNPDSWPRGYRAGLIEGLFLDADGYVDALPRLMREAAIILSSTPHAEAVVHTLIEQVSCADLSRDLLDEDRRMALLDAMRRMLAVLPGTLRELWGDLVRVIEEKGINPDA